MYTVVWYQDGTDREHSICAGNNIDAWNIYWIIQSYLKTQYNDDGQSWIAVYHNGLAVDPTKGSFLPVLPPNAKTRILIKNLA
jgi:hypothetical protein